MQRGMPCRRRTESHEKRPARGTAHYPGAQERFRIKQLEALYIRRAVVENLIQSIESYYGALEPRLHP
jgi:hypothetical protein